QGFGRVAGLDWDKVIPNATLTLEEGAVACWNGETSRDSYIVLRRAAKALKVRLNVPWKDLTTTEQDIVKFGSGEWYGIKGFFDYMEERRYKVQNRIMVARYRGFTDCPECAGTRLRAEAG